MPWFPEFVTAVELVRRQTRADGQADPVGQYVAALDRGDVHALEDVLTVETDLACARDSKACGTARK